MLKTKTRTLAFLLGGVALAVAAAGVWLLAGTAIANAAEVTVSDLQSITQTSTGPGLLGEGYLAQGGWDRGRMHGIDYQKLLADALGITVDDLRAAYESARTAAIEQAVGEGILTREQADEMLVWGGMGRKGFGFFGFRRGSRGLSSSEIDEAALLAQALEITTDELQAAREKANQAAIEQAVQEGIITQEQADEMLSRRKLQDYLNRDVLLAKALDLTVDELQAAYAEGKTLTDLMGERGLDAAAVREKLAAAHAEALAQALADGVIAQEQADEMRDGRDLGFRGFGGLPGRGGRGGFRGPGRFGGRGGFRGRHPCPPDADDSPGASFDRAFPGGSVL